MFRIKPAFLAFFALLSPAVAQDWRASPWVDFREASLRVLMPMPKDGMQEGEAGLEIRLAEGYKTYWRSPGDSGAPPVFDFSTAQGMGAIAVEFPFPTRFDDGAGGTAWGYKTNVILPIRFERMPGTTPILAFKLDFAVCGSMCIPLAAQMRFDPATGQTLAASDKDRIEQTKKAVPTRLSSDEAGKVVRAMRLAGGTKPKWRIDIATPLEAARFWAFPEAKGYLTTESALAADTGRISVIVTGEAMPGSGGMMGPVRLTFGEKGQSFEALLDLDGAPSAP